MKLVALLAAAAIVSSSAAAAGQPWQPSIYAAVSYASHRQGTIAFAVRTPTRHWSWHATRAFPSASVLKAMLLVAYLDLPSVRARALVPSDRALLAPMIRRSDNARRRACSGSSGRPPARPGAPRRDAPLHAGDRHLGPEPDRRALDQARYFLRIDSLVAPRHRAYAMKLLNTVTPAQRWGIARVRPPGWRLYFKGGWGSGTAGSITRSRS